MNHAKKHCGKNRKFRTIDFAIAAISRERGMVEMVKPTKDLGSLVMLSDRVGEMISRSV